MTEIDVKVMAGYACKAVVLLLAAQFGSLFADNILELRRLDALHHRAEGEVERLRRENHALAHEAHALQHDPFYVELTMRRKLRWVNIVEQRSSTGGGVLLCRSMPSHARCGREDMNEQCVFCEAGRSSGGY